MEACKTVQLKRRWLPIFGSVEVLEGKANAWDRICKLCPHNQNGIANCCVSLQDDYCQLMRDMRKALKEGKDGEG